MVLFWVDQGVKIFRVDNPHTKPFPVLGMAHPRGSAAPPRRDLPGRSLYAAEADEGSRQARLHPVLHLFHLAHAAWELEQYLTELTDYPERDYYRPNFFVNTPDILPYHLQSGEPWMFKSRIALAATLSGTYGIFNGFELLEHEPIPGREEYLDSEKYEIKVRDWDKPGNIKPYIRDLNMARRANPALQQTGNLRFLEVEDGNVIGFVEGSVDQTNTVAVAIALSRDVHEVWLPLGDVQVRVDSERRNVAAVETSLPASVTRWKGRHPRTDHLPYRGSCGIIPLPGARQHP